MKKTVKFSLLSMLGLLLSGCTGAGSLVPGGGGGIKPKTSVPTTSPTSKPTTAVPTSEPTVGPTSDPTSEPTTVPTSDPTSEPTTSAPTSTPTSTPTSSVDPEDYYASIDDSLTGDALKNALYNLIHPYKASGTYDNIWNDYLLYSDVAHPENTGKASSDIIAFYDGEIHNRSELNKEHVWPKSRGGDYIEGDPHMVRPALIEDNSSRGNSFYVEGKATEHDGWDPKTAGMNETYRGDSARIIFYCAVQEKNYLTLVDKETDSTSNRTMGKLSDLLRWNLNYAVQQRERNRNDILNGVMTSYKHTYHLNRNPFIDHPEYACKIWGNTNSTTRSICGM